MAKDRTWMYGSPTTSEEFLNGLFEFCNFALEHQAKTGTDWFYCPCAKCGNVDKVNALHVLRKHVIFNGFRPQYHVWLWHGEEGVYEGNRTLIDGHDQECTIQANEQKFVESTGVNDTEKQIALSRKKRGPKNSKGRGPTKGLGVEEDMYLEYDSKDQPCGKWRGKYATHIGLCIRKLSILHSWNEVPEELKKTLWDDTMDLFHIEEDEAKKNLFLSAVAQRFRDFKSKLVSGWITLKRPRTSKKKRKSNENGEGEEYEIEQGEGNEIQPPTRKPYEIWPHITKDVWDAFIAKKTTKKEVEKCAKASTSALKRKFYHHLGPKTYEQKRKEWFQEGFYPSCSASLSVASNFTATELKTDRVYDWWCSLHEKDEHGNRRIVDPETKKVADAVIEWKNKEANGKFFPAANKDALYMVLGKDHDGRVKGQGGIRLGLKKAFKEEYSASRSTASVHTASDLGAVRSSIREEVKEGVKNEVRKEMYTILKQVGITSIQLNEDEHDEQLKNHADSETEVCSELLGSTSSILVLEEETPCRLLLPKGSENDSDLIVVAHGCAQPRSEHAKVHFKEVSSSFFRVRIDDIRDGCQDLELPIPREDVSMHSLSDAHGNFVAWPCGWVRISDEIGSEDDSQGWNLDGNTKKMEKNEVSKKSKRKELQSEPNVQIEERIPSKGSTTLLDQQTVDSLSRACFWLHECTRRLVDDKSIEVFLDKNQFHYADDTSTYITKEDVCEFLSGKMLNVSFIQLFMSALYEDLRACDSLSRIGWLCPQKICAEKCLGDPHDVKYYIEHSIKECTRAGKVLIIAPYHQDTHWILLVISPSTNKVHQFDSAHVEPPRQLFLKSCLNSVLKKLSRAVLRRDSIPQWKSMKCAQQQCGVECGYYVMRYMYDIVLSWTKVEGLDTLFKTPREGAFTSAEINEIRDKCAMFITELIFDNMC